VKMQPFKAWLENKFAPNTVNTQFSSAKRVNDTYGDLDDFFDQDGIDELVRIFDYSKADERQGRPNPTKIPINGNLYTSLASYKTAIRCYARFRSDESELASDSLVTTAAAVIEERRDGLKFDLESQMQTSLRIAISQLEPGLKIIDGGSERSVVSGFIDILAEDSDGALVVIELKKGLAKRDAIGQIAGYIGDLMNEEGGVNVRGILVASDFDKSCRAAVAAIPSLKLKTYEFNFTFNDIR
jgi:endonuclease